MRLTCYFCLFLILISCEKKFIHIKRRNKFPVAYVVNGGNNSISVIDLRALNVKKTFQLPVKGRFPHHIALSPDRKKLIVAVPEFDFVQSHDLLHQSMGKKGGVISLDSENGKILLNLSLPKPNFNAVFSNDNAEIWSAATTHSGQMYVFDAKTGTQKAVFSLGADPTEIIFSKNGYHAFVALEESSFILAIDTQLKQIKKYIKVDPFPTNVWTGNDGNIYVENKNLKTISIVNETTLETYEFLDLSFKPGQIAFNRSLNELWICQAGENKVACFERKNNTWVLKTAITTGKETCAIKFSKDGKTAYIVNQGENTISVINVTKHQKIADIQVGKSPNGIVLSE
ncbi:YncE family protein [Emticicia sp. BO119]|uniref:YncE family protein n=1 Tax=Emticicia sp. BO119 TaxID=2757768 RepID=UPI0015F04CD4|nr:beta-propeller fold lactonase family protein [Emticicia sp. BO119]MBA4853418.1 beta-propeller fold lactonase family protein [Emticicia sp. BO119]